jgi:hypothetical protein
MGVAEARVEDHEARSGISRASGSRSYWSGRYPSNNRAKLPFEFSTSIEREGLKVRYGDGFGGAPLRLPWAPRRLTTGAETSSDEQTQEPSSTPVGGNDHV